MEFQTVGDFGCETAIQHAHVQNLTAGHPNVVMVEREPGA